MNNTIYLAISTLGKIQLRHWFTISESAPTTASMHAEELPVDISEKLRALMQRLGLVYGAIDVRRTPGGEYFFFEVNTAGEFLFVEERTNLPISKAIAAWLAGTTIPA